MRTCVKIVMVVSLIIGLSACSIKSNNSLEFDGTQTPFSKDYVDDFMSAFGEREAGSLFQGEMLDKKHCYNVTPEWVAKETDIRIFKFSNTCSSYAWVDGEIVYLCDGIGGYGFINAVPWDYDNDGVMDLLIASSWGSGVHRSVISAFNAKTKQTVDIYTWFDGTEELEKEGIIYDLVVDAQSPSTDKVESSISYVVYVANVKSDGQDSIRLSYAIRDCLGTVDVVDGVPEFHQIKKATEND